MKILVKQIKKRLLVAFQSTPEGKVKINLPNQHAGTLFLEFNGKIVRQWDLKINGEDLKVERLV